MYVTDWENNVLVALDNATPEVKKAIESLNEKRIKINHINQRRNSK